MTCYSHVIFLTRNCDVPEEPEDEDVVHPTYEKTYKKKWVLYECMWENKAQIIRSALSTASVNASLRDSRIATKDDDRKMWSVCHQVLFKFMLWIPAGYCCPIYKILCICSIVLSFWAKHQWIRSEYCPFNRISETCVRYQCEVDDPCKRPDSVLWGSP